MHTKFLCGLLILVGFMSATAAPPVGNTSHIDVARIIRQSVAVNNLDWKAQSRYDHRELNIKAKVDANGRIRTQQSKAYEVMLIAGSPYQRLVAIDNEPLSREQERLERAKLDRELNKREAESKSDRQARLAKYRSERADEHLLMQQMIDAFTFRFVREEELDGILCYRFAAAPNPDYRPPVEKARVLAGMRGEIWIDKQTGHWVRVRAEVTQPVEFGFFIAKVKPGTSFELDQQRVGDVWLPKRFTQNVNASLLGLYGYRTKEEFTFSDYHESTLQAQAQTPLN